MCVKPKSKIIPTILLFTMLLNSGCSSRPWAKAVSPLVQVPIKAVVLKIAFAAGSAAVQVAVEELSSVQIDAKALLRQIIPIEEATIDTPTGDVPVLMVVNKETNDILYWQLTDHVKMVRLRHEQPGAIELKVINEAPLRVELWIDGNLDALEVEIELAG